MELGYESTLPPSVLAAAEFAPIEDVVLPILRGALPGAAIYSEVPNSGKPTEGMFPFAVVRVNSTPSWFAGDDRFIDWATIFVHTYAKGENADADAAVFSEAIRVALRDAWRNQTMTPHGCIASYRATQRAGRQSDWATSSSGVQYAELPTGVMRYEAMYQIKIRRPVS